LTNISPTCPDVGKLRYLKVTGSTCPSAIVTPGSAAAPPTGTDVAVGLTFAKPLLPHADSINRESIIMIENVENNLFFICLFLSPSLTPALSLPKRERVGRV
jgi:hypothetical protein